MILMTRIVAKFGAAALAALLLTAPSFATENLAFVSASGSGAACTAAQPCASVVDALNAIPKPVRVICLEGAARNQTSLSFLSTSVIDIDCPQGVFAQLGVDGANSMLTVRHLNFTPEGFGSGVAIFGSGTVILEDCTFMGGIGSAAVDIEPNGSLNVVIRNSRISNNSAGILLKPSSGGSIHATLDHATISQNAGGGIKIDTTNGPVTVDITDSVIGDNAGNGLNAVGGANQNMVSIKNSVIAKNGVAGIQANGANAAVLVQTTLLDQNASGATSVVGGGHISTYGNNSIVGSSGSGFTGSAPLQ
jgi:hypothetical protein